jgi:gliding motility-associated-like protein
VISDNLNLRTLLSILALIFIARSADAQSGEICPGSLGDPIRTFDFGRGPSDYGPSLGLRDYRYVNPNVESVQDGSYTIAKSTAGLNDGWYDIRNHTPGDFNGYMMVVNASHTPGVFYESTTPILLCPNTTYEFAAWVANMLKYSGVKPSISFVILDMNNNELGRRDIDDLNDEDPSWKFRGFLFRTTLTDRVKIRMINNVVNTSGEGGNDIVIDDITFRACGPAMSAGVNDTDESTANICEGNDGIIKLSVDVDGPATLRYQWQKYNGSTWQDIEGETQTTTNITIDRGDPVGRYDYRLAAAEGDNLNSPNCRTMSPTLSINVNPYPKPEALSNGPVCIGDALILDVAGAEGTYEWRKEGSSEVISREKSPVLPGATDATAGLYTVSVNSLGCERSANVNVSVIPPPEPAVGNSAPEICEGQSVQLSASGGTFYSWSPVEGLSDPEIKDPIASPLKTTLYTVKVISGSCFRTTTVNVIVNKIPKADAGPDKKILLAYDTRLEGKAAGDEIDFFWTPSTGLDDPRSLNPKASPGRSTTYTLNVVSRLGCITAVDEVFVKVYEKLIVPNIFSPNGDGINDSWNITAIDAFDTSNVKVMNRYGEMVFESSGYTKAWDGKYKNNDLPAGVYYYIIKLRSDINPVSGSVTLIR